MSAWFDPKITVAVLISLALQTAAGLVWAGAAAQRLAQVEHKLARHDPMIERLARIEQRLDDANAALSRLEDRVDRQ